MTTNLQARIERLTSTLARAQALAMLKEQTEARRTKQAARKADTRRKIELGGLVALALRRSSVNPTPAALVGALTEALVNGDAERVARWEKFGQALLQKSGRNAAKKNNA